MIRASLFLPIAALIACETDIRLGDLPLDATVREDATASREDATAADATPRDANAPDAAEPDAGEGDAGEEDAGAISPTHDFEVFGNPDVMCVDALAGNEASFRMLAPADVGFSAGSVLIARSSTTSPYDISGPTILANFGVSRLVLMPVPDGPGLYSGGSYAVSGPGPLGTRKNSAFLGIDETMSVFPSLSAVVGMEYINTSNDGSCFVLFAASMSEFL